VVPEVVSDLRTGMKFKVSSHTEEVERNFITAVGYYLSISGSLYEGRTESHE